MNATKETDPDILRRMIEIERDQATEIQASLSNELDRLRAEVQANKKLAIQYLDWHKEIEIERESLRAENERLRSALDAL